MGFPGGSDGKESACNVGDLGLIYILAWRSPMDRRPWWATVHGVAKSWTQLTEQSSMHTYIHTYIYIYTHTHTFENILIDEVRRIFYRLVSEVLYTIVYSIYTDLLND